MHGGWGRGGGGIALMALGPKCPFFHDEVIKGYFITHRAK